MGGGTKESILSLSGYHPANLHKQVQSSFKKIKSSGVIKSILKQIKLREKMIPLKGNNVLGSITSFIL